MILYNKPELKQLRRELRADSTTAERILWKELRNNKLAGRKFKRQYSIDRYIIDFYCPSEKLAIELDGEGHYTPEAIEQDSARTAFINSLGVKVIRFENVCVVKNLEYVLSTIIANFKDSEPHPNPLLNKERE